jgi:hypothetical protein
VFRLLGCSSRSRRIGGHVSIALSLPFDLGRKIVWRGVEEA